MGHHPASSFEESGALIATAVGVKNPDYQRFSTLNSTGKYHVHTVNVKLGFGPLAGK